jgi:hypothetical protein
VKSKPSRTDSHDGFFTIQIVLINVFSVPLSYILLCGRRVINFCRELSLVIEEDKFANAEFAVIGELTNSQIYSNRSDGLVPEEIFIKSGC